MFFELENNNKKINIFSIYRSPSADADLFIQDLRNHLQLYSKDCTAFIVGDINVDILCDRPDRSTNEYLSLLYEFKFIPAINKYNTIIPGFAPACLDHMFVKIPQSLDRAQSLVLQADITDHYPTMICYKLHDSLKNLVPDSERVDTKVKIDFCKLTDVFGKEKWEDLLKSHDVNSALESFIGIYITHVSSCSIGESPKSSSKYGKLKPWITHGMLVSIRKKEKLYAKIKKTAL